MSLLTKGVVMKTFCRLIAGLIPGSVHWTTDPSDLAQVRSGFSLCDATDLPAEYVQCAVVIKQGFEVVGACCFVQDQKNFRTPGLYPYTPLKDSIEMNGLWIFKPISHWLRLKFYLKVCYEIFARYSGRAIYFSYETHKKSLAEFYDVFTEWVVYHGPVKHQPGMNPEKEYVEKIVGFTPDYLAKSLPYLVYSRLRKIVRHAVSRCLTR
jgi:hypothetical protein